MEGVSRHGRAASVCRPLARGREDGAAVRGLRHFAQDRLQDLRALQRLRARGVYRSQSAAVSPGESAARAARGDDRPVEARVPGLGRAQDPGEAPAAGPRRAAAGDQYGPRGARPPRLGQAAPPPPARGRRHCALAPDGAECPLVCRLQRRVPARQSAILLSAHHHRLREPLPVDLRGAVDDAGAIRVYRLRADVPGLRAPRGDSHRQRGALCVAACALRAEQTGGVVAAARHSHRAHPAGPAPAERPARADATAGTSGCISR